ncbi:MAG: serine hydrolase [Breznakibacter sp.]
MVISHGGTDPMEWQEVFRIEETIGDIGFSLDEILARPYLFKSQNLNSDVERLARAVERNLLNRNIFEERVQWALTLRLKHEIKPANIKKRQLSVNHLLARREVYENAVVLARNQNNRLPFRGLAEKEFVLCDFRTKKTDEYKKHLAFHHNWAYDGHGMSILNEIKTDKPIEAIVFCDAQDSLPAILLHSLRLKPDRPSISWTLVLSGEFNDKSLIKNDYGMFTSVIIGYTHSSFFWECATESLFGGLAFNGRSVSDLPSLASKGVQFLVPKTRMKLGIPEEVGMNGDTLKAIDKIVKEAIEARATPGAQVLVARNGVVVYQKAFGQTNYQNGQNVTNAHLYDVASVTKVMSTTPLLMYLSDRQKLHIQKTLKDYLPELAKTNKANITIAELLVHKSGLQANMPTFYDLLDRSHINGNLFNRNKGELYPTQVDERLYMHRDVVFKPNVFSNRPDSVFSIEVANEFYLSKYFSDSLRNIMDNSPVAKLKAYKYSDLGLGFLQRVVEKNFQVPIDQALDSIFFHPMDLVAIGYRPLGKFGRHMIVPTENEQLFRKQLLQGYVHDPGAALMGGVAGHAGLFSNSAELAKMMQLYLDKGHYGDRQLIKSETVALFSGRYDAQSRRGLGFDKPDLDNLRLSPVCAQASGESFGHTGFTGTIVWADPKNGLVFVFLSNRVCPEAWNKRLIQMDIRSKAMTVAYSAIDQ